MGLKDLKEKEESKQEQKNSGGADNQVAPSDKQTPQNQTQTPTPQN